MIDANKTCGECVDGQTANLVVAMASIGATIIGPIVAVVITFAWENARRSREGRHLILQTLLATRGRHDDPSYSWAIRTTPLQFARNPKVLAAHSRYMDAVRVETTPDGLPAAEMEMGRRQGILISEMLQDLGFKGLTSQQVEVYTAQGLVNRERLFQLSLEALPHLAISAKRSADASEEIVRRMRGEN